jgi:hypothetical protein
VENKQDNIEVEKNQPLIHDFNSKQNMQSAFTSKVMALLVVVVLVGLVTGYILANKTGSATGGSKSAGILNTSSVSKGTVIGSNDTATFKDTTEGVLKTGGIEGEGAYHLVRPGGDSQNVYLISSSVDLSKLIDKKIKVWGQTLSAQHAGWLMDVGRIEVL